MIDEKQKIIDFLLENDSEITIEDISRHCQMENKLVEKYVTILVLTGLVRMKRQIGMPELFYLR
ncbi:MAG: hypothetical protein M8349_01800 [ANME-2 cluster archaeon]|nr:hypothetical protein [ANME-2 cluster archaeon]